MTKTGRLRRVLFWLNPFLGAEYGSYLATRSTGSRPLTQKMWGRSGTVTSSWRAVSRGSKQDNHVALTFDDGPTPGVTDRILDVLQAYAAHATFFQIGQKVATSPELARRVFQERHEIGNHTFTHPRLSQLSSETAAGEIKKCQEAIHAATGRMPRWFRPPYGALKLEQDAILIEARMHVAFWNVNAKDWQQPGAEKIARRVLATVRPGSIIVLHDQSAQTVEALPKILEGLRRKNLQSVTLTALTAKS